MTELPQAGSVDDSFDDIPNLFELSRARIISEFDTRVLNRGTENRSSEQFRASFPTPRTEKEYEDFLTLLAETPDSFYQLCDHDISDKKTRVLLYALRNILESGDKDNLSHYRRRVHGLAHDEVSLILAHNEVFFAEAKKKFEQEVTVLIEDFLARFRSMVTKQNIEVDSLAILRQRLSAYQLHVVDSFQFHLSQGNEDTLGKLNEDTARILIPASVVMRTEVFRHALYHELSHAISGKTVYEFPEFGLISIDRTGVGFKTQTDAPGEHLRFDWLNEAITEHIAMDLAGVQRSSSYVHERSFFILLCQRRPDIRRLFLNAYFESYDPSAPQNERLPAWRQLTHTLADMYFPGVLVALDTYIKEQGIEDATARMREGVLMPRLTKRYKK